MLTPCVLLALPLAAVTGCSPDPHDTGAAGSREHLADRSAPPRFEDYPAQAIHRGPAAQVDLTVRPDLMARHAAIASIAASGPSFAGSYAFALTDGVPSGVDVVLIDLRSGALHPVLSAVAPVHHRVDSRLLVVEPTAAAPGEPRCGGCSASYFVWDGERLQALPGEAWADAPPPEPVLRDLASGREGRRH